MIINGLGADGAVYDADVCIIGSGAAGIPLALQLADSDLQVTIVESGGLQFSMWSHSLLDVELGNNALPRLVNNTRERYFGGTTNHWGGVCRVLDPFEFEPHSWVNQSGWPIDHDDLLPYYARAADFVGLTAIESTFDPDQLGVSDKRELVSSADKRFRRVLWHRAAADRLQFGPANIETIRSHPRIQCVLNTTVAEVYTNSSGERAEWAEGRTYKNDRITFKAKRFVLCTGAIENARLLLNSDSIVPTGLGNANDLVGRYFMDHGGRALGYLMSPSHAPITQEEMATEAGHLVGWTTSESARRSEQLLGFMSFVVNARPVELPHATAVAGLLDPASINSGISAGPGRTKTLLLNTEQSPNPDSRIRLSGQRDKLGIRRAFVDIAHTSQDVDSLVRSAQLLSTAVARAGGSRLKLLDLNEPKYGFGGHQMGTTRMADDPTVGVTDRDCRVHSMENLYIGGSSLYPTGGWQHPTFTIVALALRLADHLVGTSPAQRT